jgi:hypothetical protein
MDAATTIQDAVARVAALRKATRDQPEIQRAAEAVKRVQALRFAGTYADLLAGDTYAQAARFFLEELYSDKDYAQRDAQFSRIANPLGKYFPQKVVATAVSLAQLHVLTEEMDDAMARAWAAQTQGNPAGARGDDATRYLAAWRFVGNASARECQLRSVLAVGHELERLVRLPGLRMALRMMRRPAKASGMGDLQRFLEAGFDTFAGLVQGKDRGSQIFLETIENRETQWISQLFNKEADACADKLRNCLATAR